jgi:protein-S-isoprenylcysteine O-methyltransferase Ste14
MTAALALGLYLVGLALALGWRTVAQWRATGDTGLRLDAGPAGSLTWWGAGLALMVPNPISLAATAVLVASIQLQVRAVEEPYLARTHGSTCTTYAARVGRSWPGIGRRIPIDR